VVEVEIDFRKSARENAERYFSDAKKARRKSEAAEKALIRSMSAKPRPASKDKPVLRESGEWFEKFRWMTTSDGFLVIAGRDASQNEILFKKHAEPGDKILHADISGAPLTLVRSGGKEVGLEALKEAAVLAACYSSAWKRGLGSVDVFWADPDDVSKTPKAGEYLAKGSFIFHKRNFLKSIKLELAIGNAGGKIISGPEAAVRKQTDRYALIRPGSKTQNEIANIIAKKIGAGVNDVQRKVPAGGSTVV